LTKVATRVSFRRIEESYLRDNEICRIATSHGNIPHVTTVNYLYVNHFIYFATDYNTRKYRNLEQNRNMAIIIDSYRSSSDNKAVLIQGVVEFIERGTEFRKLYKLFSKKFKWVKNDPWREGEAPFVKVVPKSKVSWGFE
jgi:nitroimidazol reductase NimA-like FMN-containing flavoprotein (pyridoxamine 5'-phosphate oxidase superfamily)